MIKYIFRHNKDYSRFNIIKQLLEGFECKKDIFILMPFSKNQFLKHFFKRKKIVNDFFISNYDTYVNDRKKITKRNPRAWWKYIQDYINFKFSYYLLSDTLAHFNYWETLFGQFSGKHFVLPVLADKKIYYPSVDNIKNEVVKILFYGSFSPLHGIDVVLKALKKMEEDGLKFKAEIIGNGQIYKQMKTIYNELNLKNVDMNGRFMNEQELAKNIRESDIVLGIFGTSKKAQSVVPNKVYQGLACKKTVVTMNSYAIDEFFSSDDLVQCDNNPQSLYNTLKILLNDEDMRKKYAENGYGSFVNLYDNTQKKFINFFKNIDEQT